MSKVETVLIKSEENENGVLINAEDFIEGVQELFSGSELNADEGDSGSEMTKAVLKASLKKANVGFTESMNKAELFSLYETIGA